ncbi:MAG: hypothetical protein QM757_31755 [Paludibaculum sp.]
MSATLHGDPISAFLGGCPVLRAMAGYSTFRPHAPACADALETQVAEAVETLVKDQSQATFGVPCPEPAEIRRSLMFVAEICAPLRRAVMPLHGLVPPQEQDRAVAPAGQRKVILSTNVAESSIYDRGASGRGGFGLARIPKDNPWTGLARIEIQAGCPGVRRPEGGACRAHRAGRVLHTEEDFLRQPAYDTAEITRRELAQCA